MVWSEFSYRLSPYSAMTGRHCLGVDSISKGFTALVIGALIDEEEMRYGRGFWRGLDSELLILEGDDAGVSGRTWHDPATGITASVLANRSEDVWPVLQAIDWR